MSASACVVHARARMTPRIGASSRNPGPLLLLAPELSPRSGGVEGPSLLSITSGAKA